MLERRELMLASGDNKSGDSANFGVFKQNWGMLRQYCSNFKGQTAEDSNNGAALKYVVSVPGPFVNAGH